MLLSYEFRVAGTDLPVTVPVGGMPSLERLFRLVGGGAVVVGLLVVVYGFAATATLDPVAMLAGVFVVVVGLTLVAAGVLWPRLEGPGGPSI